MTNLIFISDGLNLLDKKNSYIAWKE